MRRLIVAWLLVAMAGPLTAQEIFVAPNPQTVFAFTEEGIGENPAHVLYVVNNSTVPIVVFGVTLSSCDNIRQPCGSRQTKIKVGAKRRANVGRVEPRDRERAWEYRWNFSYHADSSDAAALAALRAHGLDLQPAGMPRASQPAPASSPADAPAPTSDPVAGVRDPALASQLRRALANRQPDDTSPIVISPVAPEPERPAERPVAFRVKLGWGSIIGSTMVPDKPVIATGSCLNPAETEKLEHDQTIARTPWRPAVLEPNTGGIALPTELRDSTFTSNDVLVRFATDTSGAAIPESVSVLESPYGALSVAVCKKLFSETAAKPARDRNGRAIRSWIQMPLRVVRY